MHAQVAKFTLLVAALIHQPASADCFDDAARFHGVNPWVTRAIAKVESGGNPKAINTKNVTPTIDIGLLQINTIWLPILRTHGIAAKDLLDACTNVYVGTWIYARQVARHGNTWTAVGAYHSPGNPRLQAIYINKVWGVLNSWQRKGLIPMTKEST
jgi:soluble lytic murein transglycosylase-like protein